MTVLTEVQITSIMYQQDYFLFNHIYPFKAEETFSYNRRKSTTKIGIMDPQYTHTIAKKNNLARLPELRNALLQEYPTL